MAAEPDTEIREVVSDDPSLSTEANRVLTDEARAAVGADRVRVPRETPHTERGPAGTHSSIGESFAANRILVASYVRWAAPGVCTVISVGAFVVLMGWLGGEL